MQTKHLYVLIHIRTKGEFCIVKLFSTDHFKAVLLFVDHFWYLCFTFVMLYCLFIAALWLPAVKGLTSCLSLMCFCHFPHVVSWARYCTLLYRFCSLPHYLLFYLKRLSVIINDEFLKEGARTLTLHKFRMSYIPIGVCVVILSSTANATLFYPLILQKIGFFLCLFTIFLHYQTQGFSVHVRIKSFGYKHTFLVFYVHNSRFFAR